jgi:hypothetical protein
MLAAGAKEPVRFDQGGKDTNDVIRTTRKRRQIIIN